MDQTLAQVVALVAHGNAWLAGDRRAPAGLAPNSTFQFVRAVRFERRTSGLFAKLEVAEDTDTWLRQLALHETSALWLDTRQFGRGALPDHIAAAFANGARASILAEGPKPERWVPTWSVGRQATAEEKHIWDVLYVGGPDRNGPPKAIAVDTARARLLEAAEAARDLARRVGWLDWAGYFDEALGEYRSIDPAIRYNADLLPPGSPLERRQLIALAVGSHVFGGMGSWNDMDVPRDETKAYRHVSETLYAAILEGLMAGANPQR